MSEGIKAIGNVLDLAAFVGEAVAAAVGKDGFQRSDLLAFVDRPGFKEKFDEVRQEVAQVEVELADLGPFEVAELVVKGIDVARRVFVAYKRAA